MSRVDIALPSSATTLEDNEAFLSVQNPTIAPPATQPRRFNAVTATAHQRAPDFSVLAWTIGIALVWLITAFVRSDTTMHLGPLLLPMVPAALGRDTDHPLHLTLVGVAAGAAVITVLYLTGNLSGPALSPFSDALTESIALLAVGGVAGLGATALMRRR
jgi:hypothetical protein